MNILEAIDRQALIRPTAPALVVAEQVLSYGDLAASVLAMASRLAEEGVRRGDIVILVVPGLVRHVVLTLAIAHLGAASMALSGNDDHSAALAQASGAKFLVHGRAEGFRIAAPCVGTQMSLHSLGSRPPKAAAAMVRTQPDELFRIGLSSGTTGRPKGIKLTHGAMVLRTHLTRTVYPIDAGERLLLCLPAPLYFSLGYWLLALTSGATVIAAGTAPMDTLRQHRAQFLLGSPTTAVDLLKVAQDHPEPPPHLRTVCLGGASVSPAMQLLLRRHLCPNLFINYGMTEAGGLVAVADPAVLASHPTSAGRLMPWVEVEAVGDDDQPLPAGERGRLRMRSPTMATGYVDVPGAGAPDPFRDGWFYSSDHGRVLADGLVFLGGRADVLNVAGRKVDPARIEEVIAQDPAILECVAIAMPDPLGQQQLVTAVVAPQGVDAEALKQRCLAALGASLVPVAVFEMEELPHNEAGKVLRREVADRIRQAIAASAGPSAALLRGEP